MNIFILCNHELGLPTIQELAKANVLKGLATTSSSVGFIQKLHPLVKHFSLPLLQLNKGSWQKKLGLFLRNKKIDVVFVLTFKYKIPAKLLAIPKWGFINFHPGPLPEYRGPDPVFWQIKRQLAQGTLTVHQMDAQFDTGPIIGTTSFPIKLGMTHSYFMGEAGFHAVKLASGIVQLLHNTGTLPTQKQREEHRAYLKRPTQQELRIDWQTKTASSIQALVNACNYSYGGAITVFRQQPLQILQVSLLNEARNTKIGQTIYADSTNGWVVASQNGQLIRIDIVQSGEGIMTGARFVEMVIIKVGEILS